MLEYFHGILIMTTNRVLKMDIAMLSRIHYAVHFQNLSPDQEASIWQQQRDQLTKKNCSDLPAIDKWIKDKLIKKNKNQCTGLNGREIHNVFKTAQRLGDGEGEKIRESDLEEAFDAVTTFRTEMKQRVSNAQKKLVVNTDDINA